MDIEYIGYFASFLIIVSFLFKDIIVLRSINIFGSIFFMIYGFLLDISYPIIITNGFLLVINIYQIIKIFYKPKN